MRLIGAAERGMQMMVERALQRRVFGKMIAQQGSFLSDIAKVTPICPRWLFFSDNLLNVDEPRSCY